MFCYVLFSFLMLGNSGYLPAKVFCLINEHNCKQANYNNNYNHHNDNNNNCLRLILSKLTTLVEDVTFLMWKAGVTGPVDTI